MTQHYGTGDWVVKVTWRNEAVDYHYFTSKASRDRFAKTAGSKRAIKNISRSKRG